jgi:hypothetical protein
MVEEEGKVAAGVIVVCTGSYKGTFLTKYVVN